MTFWRNLVHQSLDLAPTPFYLCSVEPIEEALAELAFLQAQVPLPIRHWLSLKTQPLSPLLSWWKQRGHGVEVVSEFELRAALEAGYEPGDILINGPAKHRWLHGYQVPNLRVNFDSATEIKSLLPLARRLNWSVGIRCQTNEEFDPDQPPYRPQFGMPLDEAAAALKHLKRAGVRLETIHFHLRTNVDSAKAYSRGIWDVALLCQASGFVPKYLDCGGGFPAHHVQSPTGAPFDVRFDLREIAAVYERALKVFPGLRELWLENGRFVSARSGVLVVRIWDTKELEQGRHLICDGGRTMNALVSTWEAHEIFTLPPRRGAMRLTSVCGPTCMAFDQLARRPLPSGLQVGDYLVWMDAGAYHLSWETRFSHGHAAVLWHQDSQITLARAPQAFEDWWPQKKGDGLGTVSAPGAVHRSSSNRRRATSGQRRPARERPYRTAPRIEEPR